MSWGGDAIWVAGLVQRCGTWRDECTRAESQLGVGHDLANRGFQDLLGNDSVTRAARELSRQVESDQIVGELDEVNGAAVGLEQRGNDFV